MAVEIHYGPAIGGKERGIEAGKIEDEPRVGELSVRYWNKRSIYSAEFTEYGLRILRSTVEAVLLAGRPGRAERSKCDGSCVSM